MTYDTEYAKRLVRFHQREHGALLRQEVVNSIRAVAGRNGPKSIAVLDYGCGLGHFSEELARVLAPSIMVTGYDPNLLTLHGGTPIPKQRSVKFTPRLASAERGTYDAVVCSNVLGHTKDPKEELQAMHSMLRFSGRLLLTVPSRLYEQAMLPKNLLSGYRSDPTLLHRWYGWQLAGLVRECGFLVGRMQGVSRVSSFFYEDTFIEAVKYE